MRFSCWLSLFEFEILTVCQNCNLCMNGNWYGHTQVGLGIHIHTPVFQTRIGQSGSLALHPVPYKMINYY